MDTCYCEHHKIIDVDDETFLLDNENVNVTNNCVRCRKLNSSSWLNGEVLPINGLERNATDHFDSPEDSPLLINVSLLLLYSGQLIITKKIHNFTHAIET